MIVTSATKVPIKKRPAPAIKYALSLYVAGDHQILALPTLVRQLPSPIRKIIGDLSNTERVLVGLDIKSAK